MESENHKYGLDVCSAIFTDKQNKTPVNENMPNDFAEENCIGSMNSIHSDFKVDDESNSSSPSKKSFDRILNGHTVTRLQNPSTSLSMNNHLNVIEKDVNDAESNESKEIHQTSEIICNLFPHLKQNDIKYKLQKHSKNKSYKVKLLQKCITNSVEGNNVKEEAFFILDEWLNESQSIVKENSLGRPDVNSVCQDIDSEEKNEIRVIGGNRMKNEIIDLSVIPDVTVEENKDSSEFSASNTSEKMASYMDSFDSLYRKLKDNTSDASNAFSNLSMETSYPDSSLKLENEDKVAGSTHPLVVNLVEDIDSPASNHSDICLVEEVPPEIKASDQFDEDFPQQQDQDMQELPLNLKNDESTKKKLVKDDIESDILPWNEAHAIIKLLPFLLLNNVYQSIMDNYYHPERKVIVLREYIELAIEEGSHELNKKVFETLDEWQSSKKRHISEVEESVDKGHKMRKSSDVSSHSSPSTSSARITIPTQNSELPSAVTHVNDLPYPLKDKFKSLPLKSQSWYLEKVDFIYEIVPHHSKPYILFQIIDCQTDDDIMHVVTTLIAENTSENPGLNLVEPDIFGEIPENLVPNENGASALVPTNTILFTPDPNNSTSVANQSDLNPSTSDQTNSSNALTPNQDDQSLLSNQEEAANQMSAADIEDKIQSYIQKLSEMFSDADPDFINERVTEGGGDHEKFVQLVVEMTDKKTYPKMEDYLKRQEKISMRKKFIEGMSVEEFLQYFEDPEKIFCDTTKEMSKLYTANARAQLMKDLPFHLSKTIDFTFKSNNYHYLPTLRALKNEVAARKTKRSVGGKQPGDLDDIFLKELCFTKMEGKIKDHYKKKEKEREEAFQKAKENNELLECQCCCDDEVLKTEMSACENLVALHWFCNNCIKRHSEEQIGQGKQEFKCLEGECESPFSLNTLKKLLKPSIFSNLLKRKQAEEIAAAEIEDLESCPFCNFATIMPNKEDKVFKCLNPQCLKDSCRLCKELNHIPLRCEEVEKQKQTEVRTFLEKEMTEAMVRECYKCKKRFIKEDGCNKIICSCGAMMCYLCKQPISGYGHFKNEGHGTTKSGGKCPLWSHSGELHAIEVQKRTEELKEGLDPTINLVHNPLDDVPEIPKHLRREPQPAPPIVAAVPVRLQAQPQPQPQPQVNALLNPLNNPDLALFMNIVTDFGNFAAPGRHHQNAFNNRLPLPNHLPPPPSVQLNLPPTQLPHPPPAHQPVHRQVPESRPQQHQRHHHHPHYHHHHHHHHHSQRHRYDPHRRLRHQENQQQRQQQPQHPLPEQLRPHQGRQPLPQRPVPTYGSVRARVPHNEALPDGQPSPQHRILAAHDFSNPNPAHQQGANLQHQSNQVQNQRQGPNQNLFDFDTPHDKDKKKGPF